MLKIIRYAIQKGTGQNIFVSINGARHRISYKLLHENGFHERIEQLPDDTVINIPRKDEVEDDRSQLTNSKESEPVVSNVTPLPIIASVSNDTALSKMPIYYISSNEGVGSHMKQLEIIWNIANSVNRQLIIVPFENHEHYVNSTHICNIMSKFISAYI